MKRLTFIIHFLFALAVLVSAQSKGQIIDDTYLTPDDKTMVEKTEPKSTEQYQRPVYKNGAKEIVFIDQNGNRTNMVSDTVYVVDNSADSVAVDSLQEDGYYLNGFKGSQSDFEYAERIRRFHNPRYSIFIGDPRYNDIYFLDNYDWNVYVDGSYAYVTPTWTNPYWWNYNFSPYSSWSWGLGWGSYWGSPYWYSYYGWSGFYNPWYTNYWGWNYPYYGGYYGWGSPYYGGYPYYGGFYGYSYDRGADNSYRRSNSTYNGRSTSSSSNSSRRVSTVVGDRSGNPYTVVSRTPSSTSTSSGSRGNSTVNSGSRPVRSSYNGAATYSTRTDRSGGIINRSSSSGDYNSRGSNSSSNDSRSRQTYSTPSRSSSTYESNRSSGSYSSGSRSSGSSGGSYSGGGSSSGSSRSSSSSSSSGGRR